MTACLNSLPAALRYRAASDWSRMTLRTGLVVLSLVLSVLIGATIAGRGRDAAPGSRTGSQPLIGLSLGTLQEERWQRDRDRFVARAEELGARVIVQSGNSETARQLQDIESLLSRGVQVLVVVAHDPTAMGRAVDAAHAAGVPVVCYDRLITGCDVNLYLSFDNVRVGRIQAEYLVRRLGGKGRIVRVHGPKTDQTGLLFKQGQDEVLAPLIARGDIVVVHEDYAAGWKPAEAKRIVNAAITARGPAFDAVLATNDGTAGGAIQALIEEGLAGKVLVTGQDADLAACQRIVRGTQTMSVYKPLARLADRRGGCGRRARPPPAGDRPRRRAQRRQGSAQHPRVRGRRRPRQPRGDRDPRRLPPRGGPAMSRPGDDPPRLEACGVAKHFGGVKALDGVDFDVRAGEVHALCGENGAGKSTLIKVLSGVHPFGSYAGSIRVDGREARFRGPRDAEHAGIAVIHQELALVEEMSVAENLFLGALAARGACWSTGRG